jgi:GntR family transcriptional regulator
LSELLSVSRPTLRDALSMLVERGLIVRRHGRGTFVREHRIQKDLNRNFGITDMIKSAGYTPSATGTQIRSVPADAEVAVGLDVPVGNQVWEIERVRLADDRPVVLSTDYVTEELLEPADIQDIISGSEQSVYTLLYNLRGLTISRGEAQLAPCKTTAKLRTLLGVKPGAALLCIRQVDFDQRDRPVVYSVEYHVADWVSFNVERVGPGLDAIDRWPKKTDHPDFTAAVRDVADELSLGRTIRRDDPSDLPNAVPRQRSLPT